ncbi:MAG: M28 family peptidase [Bacteroidaceae bacterium]|nr:M28 family peptidase [Bacteroidaceae bacterium]
MRKNYICLILTLLMCSAFSCGGSKNTSSSNEQNKKIIVCVPTFNADSAYVYTAHQVEFGPRVPNTKTHDDCGNYLAQQLKIFGAKVTKQSAGVIAYDGTLLKATNIIGSYRPESKKRIALFTHWDTRPWADEDPDPKNHHTPILGANDGASGVGVLLEIARLMQHQLPDLGIDLIFLDAEDYGDPEFYKGERKEESWCLGTQYWARNPHVDGYNARFGILLDMVGGQNAAFLKEAYSEQFAPDINKKVWKIAKQLGYGKYFIDKSCGYVTDDHLFVNNLAHIKTIDIINNDMSGKTSFGPTWHTLNDNMEHIDKSTLKAVGQTVMEVIYNEH